MSEKLFYIPPLGPTKFISSEEAHKSRMQSAKKVSKFLNLWLEDDKELHKKKKARDKEKGMSDGA